MKRSVATAAIGSASPVHDRLVKHHWSEIPHGWEYHSRPSANHKIPLRIGLKQDRVDELISSLYEVSDPFHEKYGHHLTKDEVEALVSPSQETSSLVHDWLVSHGVPLATISYSPARDWLYLPPLPLQMIERMLSASFLSYRHTSSGALATRTLSYSLPRHLHAHIDVVHPTTVFDGLRDMRATFRLEDGEVSVGGGQDAGSPGGLVEGPAGQDIPASCNTTVTPACLQALYRTDGYVPAAAQRGNRIGVAGYLEQANLDVQYTEGLTFPTPNVYYSTPGTAPTINDSVTPPQRDEPYLDWLDFVLSHSDMPQTFTTSYGGDEFIDLFTLRQTFPKDFAIRVCNTFAQLGARGGSVMFSSGDGGVGAGTCQTNDGTNRTIFQPVVFPATCPFVTSVGATFHIAPERGIGFSQGGFSVYFPRPDYQANAVPPFLQRLGSTYAGLFNPTGRAVPDVSAQGEGFQVIVNGTVHSVGGTSASSPTFAGIVTLLNDFRITNGRSPLGFLNPMLYSVGLSGFTDILIGNNPGCGTPGFNATEGWDAVTGLGTPDFVKLKSLLE
ncbi:hypothetical protein EW146_g402 [Bondarzewia mesenterica]|uniref:tripeptidyl-peptidase II n=1 Tax=Bondarzewia mesenterica TaxID=1095465 RepID=A0A4S4M745_9AGAM|nr:hypothetical protein EW146_g402 [Bondarzewia mesenterica]